jgi:anthranilate 1,2-dioxygenase small subunit
MKTLAIAQAVRDAATDLVAEYALAIDEDRLEDWVTLFTPDCDYRVVTRENVEQGLPNILMWCDGRDMLRDRVDSYRHVNEYNLHWDRHVIGPLRHRGRTSTPGAPADCWTVEASYSLFQTTLEGVSRLFSVGRYEFDLVITADSALIRRVLVVADTGLVPTLLATPI